MKNKSSASFYLDSDKHKSIKIKTAKEVFGRDITFGELAKNYEDKSELVEGGVFGWDGKLNIRPKYQRNFIRSKDGEWKTKLIHSIVNGRPTGDMYFAMDENGSKDEVEQLDGQQRIMTVLGFINNDYKLKFKSENGSKDEWNFNELKRSYPDVAKRILDYTPHIYVCTGDFKSRQKWFETINQPNSILTNQEIRNCNYCGPFLEDLNRHFAQTDKKKSTFENVEFLIDKSSKYFYQKYFHTTPDPVRMEVVERVLSWVAYRDFCDSDECIIEDDRICAYLEKHWNDEDASDAISFYKEVVDWVNDIFFHGLEITRHKHMPKHQWSRLYIQYKDLTKDFTEEEKIYISKRCRELVDFLCISGGKTFGKEDKKRQKIYGVYEWVLLGENPEDAHEYMEYRAFSYVEKEEMYYRQGGIDPIDGKHYELDEMESHHIIPWYLCGPTEERNHILLSKENHRKLDVLGYTPEDLMGLKKKLIEKLEQEK